MEALRIYLQRKCISQAEFAKLLGVSQPTVSDWLTGRCKPTINRLIEISDKTGISVDRLLKRAVA